MIEETRLSSSGLDFIARRTSRARRPSVTVHCDGSVVVTLPWAADAGAVWRTVAAHSGWIRRRLAALSRWRDHVFLPRSRALYLARKEDARTLVRSLLTRHAVAASGVRRIAVKDLRRNWGSCSAAGNLNFNFKIALLPESLAEYVVVHELCHLRQMNHSSSFWHLVAAALPDWRARRRELRRYHP